MTPRQAVLYRAKALLRSGEFSMICLALREAQLGEAEKAAVDQLQIEIRAGLHPFMTMATWLRHETGKRAGRIKTLARLAWMDKLMEDFANE